MSQDKGDALELFSTAGTQRHETWSFTGPGRFWKNLEGDGNIHSQVVRFPKWKRPSGDAFRDLRSLCRLQAVCEFEADEVDDVIVT